jgi:hypothetical protein
MITTTSGTETPAAALSDGLAGALLAYVAVDSVTTLRALAIDLEGCVSPGWQAAGLEVGSLSPFGGFGHMIPDGVGGGLATWHGVDCTFGCPSWVRVQRFTSGGQLFSGWPTSGVQLFPDFLPTFGQVAPDGAGGMYVGGTTASAAPRAFRLNGAGQVAAGWSLEGRSFDDSLSLAGELGALVGDGSGGVLMLGSVWTASGSEIRGQRFGPGGARLWPDSGVALSATAHQIAGIVAVSDGAGGAVVAWLEDTDSGDGFQTEVYAQRVRSNGMIDVSWPADGVLVSGGVDVSGGVAGFGNLWIASDGGEGAFVAWNDWRDFSSTGSDLYAQRVAGGGSIAAGWPASGVGVCTAPGDQANPLFGRQLATAPDGAGGVYFAWLDQRASWRVYASRIGADGTPAAGWDPDGTLVHAVAQTGAVGDPLAVGSPGGDGNGVIVFWHHSPPGGSAAVWGARLVDGAVVDAQAVSEGARPVEPELRVRLGSANPSAGAVAFEVAIPRPSPVRADILDVGGRRVQTLLASHLSAGAHRLAWDGRLDAGGPAGSGVYFLRIETPGRVAAEAFTLLR